MKSTTHKRKLASALLTFLMLLSAGITAADAGAGRTRPGGGSGVSRSGGGTARAGGATRAAGRASYGYSRGSVRYPGGFYHPRGFLWGGAGWYGWPGSYFGPYYPYSWWHWGWATVPYYTVPYASAAVSEDAPGAVETDIKPKKASVFVDGEWLGQARDYNGRFDALWLEPGTYRIEFSREGYMTLRRTIRIRAGMIGRIEDELQKGSGDDPRSDQPGEPDVTADAGVTREEAVEADPGPGLRRALLKLEVQPSDAAIYLDGEFLARGEELSALHGALPVAGGVHRLEIVRPGYESQTLEIEVSGEEPQLIEIQLERRR